MLNRFKKIDWIMMLILGLLMVASALVVRSATHNDSGYHNYDIKTIEFYAAGFVVILLCVMFDYRLLLKTWYVWYIIGIGSLVAVLLFAPKINGARSWFPIAGGLNIQPAEVMKLFLIIAVAAVLGRRQGDPLRMRTDVLAIAVVSFVPFILCMIQPDLGNAMIYVFIVLGMLWIGNIRYTYVTIGLAVVVGGLVLFVTLFNAYNAEIKQFMEDDLHKPHWYQRINTYIHPEEATMDERRQAEYAKIAIGSGGLAGDGYMQGESKNRKFIPYPYSDSIFVVIGEEFGFQGAAVLLLIYFIFIYRMILIAYQCYDLRGSFIIIGIAAMLVFQIFQNIGMMIGLMPITGITLPFISYGGTSLLLNMLCIGIVFSIRAHQEKYTMDT
ncbi:FtsW/RodA/SpoVE family cell cycle protein [Cohnella lubricantis]|uniref:Rod shape-determining protein RodA n=1 Tax=Cohnella lubricantis TaxID=2163172 RepID=A0A841TBW1_9BACL|nr:FtsW/RodA/SpoVE family cell cycle protein [Cohnella lubricantis]MBB6677616.1 rod shape-determining protein RodA [Cohnella lubricantis]MBP2116497.1 rod shape determining protein RodA [Cohnella lubricantis]